MKKILNTGTIRYAVIAIFVIMGVLIIYKIIRHKGTPEKVIHKEENLIGNQDTQAVLKHFERIVYSEGSLLYKLVSEIASYSPSMNKRLYTLVNILPETVYYDSSGGEYHLTADKGEFDEISNDTFLQGHIKIRSKDGLIFDTKSMRYKEKEKKLFSDDRFTLTSSGLKISSLGFTIDLQNKTIFFKNSIKTEIPAKKGMLDSEKFDNIEDTLKNADIDSQNLQIESNQLKYDDKTGILSYIGDVFINCEDYTITCSNLDIQLDKKQKKLFSFHLIGPVYIDASLYGYKAYCQEIFHNVNDRKTDVIGEPRIWSDMKDDDPEPLPPYYSFEIELGLIKNKYPYYPLFQRKFSQFIEDLHPKVVSKFEMSNIDLLMKFDCDSLSSDSMIYTPEFFSANGKVKLKKFSTGDSSYSTFLASDKMNDSSSKGPITITSEYLKYSFDKNMVEFENNVYLRGYQYIIKSDRLSATFDNAKKTIENLSCKDKIFSKINLPGKDEKKLTKSEKKKSASILQDISEIQIKSDKLDYNSNEHLVKYSDNVELNFGDSTIFCDNLTIQLDSENTNIEKLLASGNIKSKSKEMILTGNSAEYILVDELLHLYGNPKIWLRDNIITGKDIYYSSKDEQYKVEKDVSTVIYLPEKKDKISKEKPIDSNLGQGTVIITSDKLLFNGVDRFAEYIGNVVVVKDSMQLSADKVKIFLNDDNSKIIKIVAQDNIRMQYDQIVALGNHAIYIDDLQKLLLIGDSKVYQSDRIIAKGNQITFLIDKKQLILEGDDKEKVKTTLFMNDKYEVLKSYKKKHASEEKSKVK
jgi:lipopolysaccharide transport protein LptA/LPS export ABC transporter protein LptC